MKIELSGKAISNLKKFPVAERKKIFKKLHLLENDPRAGKKLTGELTGLFSLKAWPYRIIYQLISKQKIIYIITIQHRQSVYK
jgi:mRNA-degrading endonuclease RelE of RelBE toxin-antitoxin system